MVLSPARERAPCPWRFPLESIAYTAATTLPASFRHTRAHFASQEISRIRYTACTPDFNQIFHARSHSCHREMQHEREWTTRRRPLPSSTVEQPTWVRPAPAGPH